MSRVIYSLEVSIIIDCGTKHLKKQMMSQDERLVSLFYFVPQK